ncbi:dermonecrotic toxin domain-containing protein [Pseudomonas sp. DWP3-1-2]|uniref:dermonecrotic toxin domain-containing protein n=1 Tax=Pseudomonas sp. DWP3-1-2 TaxID=2804645 RepID=UPI003CEFE5DA
MNTPDETPEPLSSNSDYREPSTGSGLEHPIFVALRGRSAEKRDSLTSGSFSSPPFYYSTAQPMDNPATTPPADDDQPRLVELQKLNSLRKSPAMALIAHSPLLLKAWQLDMDCPPRASDYLREQLLWLLRQLGSDSLDPDTLFIRFSHDDHPAIEAGGRERYTWQVSLTDLAVLSFNVPAMIALMKSTFSDTPLHPSLPAFTASVALNAIFKSPWTTDYLALTKAFWTRHEQTYRTLAKLSFLHELHARYRAQKIRRECYQVALDALGLKDFPQDPQCLEDSATATLASASLLSINGHRIPEAFQLRSHQTSHCFIHQPDSKMEPVEYISDDRTRMAQMMLDALNASGALAHVTDPDESQRAIALELVNIEGDIFCAITQAQKERSLHDDSQVRDIDLLKPIRLALNLISAVDLWQTRPGVLQKIPSPLNTAARIMRKVMKQTHGLDINPDHVFIRYVASNSFTPMGSPRVPVTQVHRPDGVPVSLSQALVSNYRVEQALGYVDHGARTRVYIDATGKGDGTDIQELAVTAEAIEQHIRKIDFLSFMTERISRFWDEHQNEIESSFKTAFMAQAVLCLKKKLLFRNGFDVVTNAIEQLDALLHNDHVKWSAIGFNLQHSLVEGLEEVYCPNLLVLSQPGASQRVLYQAGFADGFVELESDAAIAGYIQKASKNKQWREAVLHHVPVRHHQRLDYILKIWAGEERPAEPVSLLRPWTDSLYNPDAHQAAAHQWLRQELVRSPFGYMRKTLQQNGVWDAQDIIVTSREVLLNYWTRQLNHLQLLLAPMSFVLTPALLATLATEVGLVTLNTASANLPGARYEEKRQAMLTTLSLGFFQMTPFTPAILRSFGRLVTPGKTLNTATAVVLRTRGFGSRLNRSMHTRHTRLEKFFETDSLLKTWNIPGQRGFGTLPVKAWKLGPKFLLWTSDRGKARTLVVSTHGYYLPWSKSTLIPTGTELHVYAPHGYELIDPALHRVIRQNAKPFAVLDNQANTPVAPADSLTRYTLTDKLLAGTSQPGHIKNYTLSKFQSPDDESYQYISHVVRDSNQSPLHGQLSRTPMDVLTVRKRFGMPDPTLEQLFKALFDQGIHYDRILLLHCRCPAFKSLMGNAPVYRAT